VNTYTWMPRALHSPPEFRILGPLFALLSLSFIILKGLYTIAYATINMSTVTRQKLRMSYTSDKKDPSAYEKSHSTPKVQVEESCPICQEPIEVRNKEGITERWSMLPCGHQFGSYCIKHYLRVVADDRPSCPICRQPAYHNCGHPYLPIVIESNRSPVDETLGQFSDAWIEKMRTTSCTYCRTRKNISPAWRPKARRGPLRSAGSWLLTLATHPRRFIRNRGRQEEVLRGPLLIPWQEDEDGYNGPWVDPFPRPRDPVWERWWDSQKPQEINPAEGFR